MLKQFLHGYDKGFTLTELLVVSFLGLSMLALTLSTTASNRRLYKHDLIRTKINQNLRVGLDILGIDIREAGENLPPTFPAVELINGAGSAPDELIVRRNLLDEVFNVCQAITALSTNTNITVADNTLTTPGCDKTSNATGFSNWQAHRTAHSGSVKAYIFDRVAHVGEFFDYIGEQSTSNAYTINRAPGTWAHSFPVSSSSIYVLEEWRYRLQNGVVQIISNQDTANPLDVVDGVSGFQVTAYMQDSSTKTSFGVTDTWTQIRALDISITGQASFEGQNMSKTVSAQFFPRNILSN
ncbi:MAG: prepilin-type N-terminal cleavage/methylation domain-containing protein [Oligoflexia bacterium]|nr:prepilin-type N-terminal cleavage/methylation domain-containing protein [Oligoflexia bacterium]